LQLDFLRQDRARDEKKGFFHPLSLMMGISAIIFFICSSIRHALFQSNFDLAIFDNALYLISQGEKPFIVFRGLHILGDHAAWIFYPLALLYKIHPDVHWLFAVQAISLASGALFIWHLANLAGLKETQKNTIALAYLLYPVIFNVNIFDFHPEVIAVPAILGTFLAVKLNKIWWFIGSLIIISGCKAVLALTIFALGIWLLLWEKKPKYGIIAIALGLSWFIIATQIIIPQFSGAEAAAVDRYSYLGDSVFAIAKNLFLKPELILGKIFSLDTIGYLVLLIAPVIWGFSLRYLHILIGATPILLINILSDYPTQRNLVHHYSVSIIPFLFLVVINTLANAKGWFKNSKNIVIWSVVAFLAFAKFGYFGSIYLDSLDTWQATRQAFQEINTKGGVLTTSDMASHVTHRPLVQLATKDSESMDLNKFDYILLNQRHPGWASSPEIVNSLITKLKQTPEFSLQYSQDEVFLFAKNKT
jgi:uncharacterized membrane protein